MTRFIVFCMLLVISSVFLNEAKSIEDNSQTYVKYSLHWNIKQLDTARDSMYLTDIEKNVLLEINMVRTNPKKYAELYIKPLLGKFNGLRFDLNDERWFITKEGIAAVDECIKVLIQTKSCDLIYPNRKISVMSNYHTNLQGVTEEIGHNTPKGETLIQRIKRFKIPYYCYGENIEYGSNSARDIIIRLLVDDGVPSRGHRNNILNNFFNKVGVSFGSHKKYKYMCVMDFVGYKD